MAVFSAYRQDAERWRQTAEEPTPRGMTAEQWRDFCHEWAASYDDFAGRHETAMSQGLEAEEAFWADLRDKHADV